MDNFIKIWFNNETENLLILAGTWRRLVDEKAESFDFFSWGLRMLAGSAIEFGKQLSGRNEESRTLERG